MYKITHIYNADGSLNIDETLKSFESNLHLFFKENLLENTRIKILLDNIKKLLLSLNLHKD